MRDDDSDPFASPAALLTHLLDTERTPEDLTWRLGASSVPGRWFIAAESDLDREIAVDPRGWPDDTDVLSGIWAAAEDEWAAGARLPVVWLREQWKLWYRAGGDTPLDGPALQRLLPLLPGLRRVPPGARDMGCLFALLAQHPVAGLSLPLDVPVAPSDGTTLGDTARMGDALLRLRMSDVEPSEVDRLVAAGWVAPGESSLRAPGRTAWAVLDLLRHHWLQVEVELVPPDRSPALGDVVLGDAVLGQMPAWSRT